MSEKRRSELSNSSATCSRTFNPDPVEQAFVESLPGDPCRLILEFLAKRVKPQSFDTWLKPTRFYGVDGKTLVVRIPHPASRLYVHHR
jgi:hypothetical protein